MFIECWHLNWRTSPAIVQQQQQHPPPPAMTMTKTNKIFQNILYCMYSLDYVHYKMSFISLTRLICHWPVETVFTVVYIYWQGND